jgi:hypothetical protein
MLLTLTSSPKAVELVNSGGAEFYEPGSDELLKKTVKKEAASNLI